MTADAAPLVSVVMPFKDSAEFLEEGAGCVLGQTWPAVELVLVDDGGTDGGDAIAERLQARHPDRVRVVRHPGRVNRGIGASRHLGIREARGDLVAFLDADDLWEPGHVEDVAGLLLEHPQADVVCSRTWMWRSWSDPTAENELTPLAFAPGRVVPGVRLLEAVLRNGGYSPATCSVLIRRRALGGWLDVLDDFPGMYEDQVLNASLQLRGPVLISGASTAWYRQHDRSISARELIDDAATRFDRGRDVYLRWLSDQPLLTDPGVREQLERNARELRERAARAEAATATPSTPSSTSVLRLRRLLRSVRGAAGRVVTRTELLQERGGLGSSPTGRAADRARPERLRLFFQRFGSDLRGRVLVLGSTADLPPQVLSACTDRRDLPRLPVLRGPGHPLAGLPTGSYDCVVVADGDRHGEWGRDDLRHLRRVLAPGGALLLVIRRPGEQVQQLVREAFGADLVREHWQRLPGPGRRPMLGLRALVPMDSRALTSGA